MNPKYARITTVAIFVAVLSGCAAIPKSPEARLPVSAALADGVTTHIAVTAGAVETNAFINPTPAGLVAITALKIGLAHTVDRLDDSQARRVGNNLMSASWGGAAVNNLLVVLGATPALAIVAGIGAGVALWHESDRRLAASALAASRPAAAPAEEPAAKTVLAYAEHEY